MRTLHYLKKMINQSMKTQMLKIKDLLIGLDQAMMIKKLGRNPKLSKRLDIKDDLNP